ncbi:MAG: cobalamin biosynthesis protein CobD [Bacteroidaceae bacterium]|nr:cobalamin biosynthesis protein CobD [Bacteroidaceae bacterium]
MENDIVYNGALSIVIAAYLLDCLLGDPAWLPHPVVLFGKMISKGEHKLNQGEHRKLKGALLAISLVLLVFSATWGLLMLCREISPWLNVVLQIILVFFCLAGTTLIKEVRDVFLALDRSLEEGRKQVARIVGRDTTRLSAQEVRKAALETLAENLSDGVIAPLFWYIILGVPGMMAYKMVNTLDSMIGYHSERYLHFGCFAARLDDVANYIPARLTALLMVLVAGKPRLLAFVKRFGRCHASPNSGYPESALAGILDCQFGGPHIYFGELFDKPYIGTNDRELTTADMRLAIKINRQAEILMVLITVAIVWLI